MTLTYLKNKGDFQIKIGNTWTEYCAKAIAPSFESLSSEDSGRSDDGVMHITWVKSKLRKWEIQMPPLTSDEASAIINAVQGKNYSIRIFDLSTNTDIEIPVYTSNSKADCYSGVIRNGLYEGFAFSAIEVG